MSRQTIKFKDLQISPAYRYGEYLQEKYPSLRRFSARALEEPFLRMIGLRGKDSVSGKEKTESATGKGDLERLKAFLAKKGTDGAVKPDPTSAPIVEVVQDYHNFIRGPKLEVFVPREPGVSMEQALEKAEKEKRVIASNKRLDRALVGSDEWESIRKALWCWTGTMTAYEKPGKKFGKTVEFVDDETKIRYIFEVPGQYVGEKDAILVAEHPDYKLETDGNNRIIRAAVVDLIKKFPVKSGWFLADSKHGIPFRDAVDMSDSDARYLWRIEKRVGLSARTCYGIGGRGVILYNQPSSALGVAVECQVSGSATKK